MIGQDPPLEQQGLTIAAKPVVERVHDKAFEIYIDYTRDIRAGSWRPAFPGIFHSNPEGTTIFPHQLKYIGGSYQGDWTLKWMQGMGPFAWRAAGEMSAYSDAAGSQWTTYDKPSLTVPILGPCEILVSGGDKGSKVNVVDTQSGFDVSPDLTPEGPEGSVFALSIPGSAGYRDIQIRALQPGTIFYGIRCREPQPIITNISFDHSWLPPVA